MGSSPFYLVASAIYRLSHPPYVLGSLAMLRGYFGAMLSWSTALWRRGIPSVFETLSVDCLFHGKSRATARAEARPALQAGSPVLS